MNLGETRNELDNGGNGASVSPRLASLPRYTAKAIEQLMDTMLAALRSDTGAIWVEHENSVYTLVVRNVSIQNLQLLQQMTRTRAQSSPVVLQSQGQTYAVSCGGYPLLRVYVAVKVEKIGAVHRRLMPRFARLAQTYPADEQVADRNAFGGPQSSGISRHRGEVTETAMRTVASNRMHDVVVLIVE
jgi:hypothetical protein